MGIEARVLFFTISKKMESIQRSSSQTGFVVIHHHWSKTGEWRRAEFAGSQYEEALTEVHKIETHMSTIACEVNRTPNNQLSRMRVIARPSTHENENISLLINLQNEIKFFELEIAESEALQTSEKTEKLKIALAELQSLTFKDFSWEAVDKIKKNIKLLEEATQKPL